MSSQQWVWVLPSSGQTIGFNENRNTPRQSESEKEQGPGMRRSRVCALQVIQWLLDRGADLHVRTTDKERILTKVCSLGHVHLLQYLIRCV